MSDVATLVERAWQDGVGPDERAHLANVAARAEPGDPALAELRVFAAWTDLAGEPPAVPARPAARVVHVAATLARARLAGDRERAMAAVDELAQTLAELDPADPHALAANAWADLELGELALALGDLPTARRRFEAVAASGRPVVLRVTAMLHLSSAALARLDIATAGTWARRAVTLAEHHHRYEQSTRARLLAGMLDCVAGDRAGMRDMLRPHAKVSVLARLLLAGTERAKDAMPLLAEGLRLATEQGDVLAYTLCVLVGARRYAAIGRDADALITISAGIQQLRPVAPHLADALDHERASWRSAWEPARLATAETAAREILARDYG